MCIVIYIDNLYFLDFVNGEVVVVVVKFRRYGEYFIELGCEGFFFVY